MIMTLRCLTAFALAATLLSCGSSTFGQYQVEVAFPALMFSRPVDLQNAGDGSGRLFVVEQAGMIRVFQNRRSAADAPVFLDIRARVDDSGNEEGLLGLAFHPNYADNGYFYVNYTANNPNRTVVARYSVSSGNPDVAESGSELVLLTIGQPFTNHNGGQLQFGPDGMLYIAVGDGGSGGDPQGHGQNRETLLGSILRIDVDATSGSLNYAIPADNPFVGNTSNFREEIYAYGLRNPWRMSFDDDTGRLWAADVGQNAFEEVSIIESGGNYGWKIMEAYACYNASTCDQSGLELPVHAYPHSSGNGSITGGYVYRGSDVPSLYGRYVFADFISGEIWALSESQGTYTDELLFDTSFGVSSFGVDEEGELYVCGFDGKIHSLAFSGTGTEVGSGLTGALLRRPYPNPANSTVRLPIRLATAQNVGISVFDVTGRRVARIAGGFMQAGDHTLEWNGRSENGTAVSPGGYWIRVTGSSRSASSAVVFYPS